jgi:hypothetical protein
MRITWPGLYLFTAIILVSCVPEKEKQETETKLTESAGSDIGHDTIQRNLLDTFFLQISNEGIFKKMPVKVSFPIDNPTDSLEYWVVGPGTGQIMAKIRSVDRMVWPTFFIRNNELFLVRFRYWSKTPPMYSRETMLYYNTDKIVYCKERSLEMSATDLPYMLRKVEFKPCSRARETMEREYLKYWNAVKPYADSILNIPN